MGFRSPLDAHVAKSRTLSSTSARSKAQRAGNEVCLPLDELLSYFKHACASILSLLQEYLGDWRRLFRVFVSALTMSRRFALSQYLIGKQ